MININIFGFNNTKIIIEMKKRIKKSLITGSGSFDGQLRFGDWIVYATTKSYIEVFYEGLSRDFPEKIDFTLIEIGPVKTNMNKNDIPFTNNSDKFVSECKNLIENITLFKELKKHKILRRLLSILLFLYFSGTIDKKQNK